MTTVHCSFVTNTRLFDVFLGACACLLLRLYACVYALLCATLLVVFDRVGYHAGHRNGASNYRRQSGGTGPLTNSSLLAPPTIHEEDKLQLRLNGGLTSSVILHKQQPSNHIEHTNGTGHANGHGAANATSQLDSVEYRNSRNLLLKKHGTSGGVSMAPVSISNGTAPDRYKADLNGNSVRSTRTCTGVLSEQDDENKSPNIKTQMMGLSVAYGKQLANGKDSSDTSYHRRSATSTAYERSNGSLNGGHVEPKGQDLPPVPGKPLSLELVLDGMLLIRLCSIRIALRCV